MTFRARTVRFTSDSIMKLTVRIKAATSYLAAAGGLGPPSARGDFTGNGTDDVLLDYGGTVVDWIMN